MKVKLGPSQIRGLRYGETGSAWHYRVDVRYILRLEGNEVYMEEPPRPLYKKDGSGRRFLECASCGKKFYDGEWVLAEELMRVCKICGRIFCHKCSVEIQLWDDMQICRECLDEKND